MTYDLSPPWMPGSVYIAMWFALVEEKLEEGDRTGYDLTTVMMATNLADAYRPIGLPG